MLSCLSSDLIKVAVRQPCHLVSIVVVVVVVVSEHSSSQLRTSFLSGLRAAIGLPKLLLYGGVLLPLEDLTKKPRERCGSPTNNRINERCLEHKRFASDHKSQKLERREG